ncbi:hypothetical protein P3H15_53485 [Rhodococcus sp. T2V]|uniref:hypothetical protein n=1 Tax=Rhodococcus sp. T2V TaxID=3034164 RepID=UPI0023E0EAC6|nr:hypothetical protein [Rhodococcus sp. T2V]MDF3313695.1 hypothetical protein [Rhodococcus sp. T2V]
MNLAVPQPLSPHIVDGAALKQTLTEAGVTSIEALVEKYTAKRETQLFVEDRLSFVASGARQLDEAVAPKPHTPPEMNLTIDGESHDPAVITELDGRPLYSTPGIDSKGDPVLHSFTSPAGMFEHLANTPWEPHASFPSNSDRAAGDIGTTNPDSLPALSYYFENAYKGGDWLQNGPGRAWRDLRRVPRGIFHLGDWNDIISSVDWCRWDISLYEHPGYQPTASQLYLRAGRTYYYLAEFGWSDKASSTVNWGQRF